MNGEMQAVPTSPEEKLEGAASRTELAAALRMLYHERQVP